MDLFSIAAKIRLDSSDFESGIRKADSSGKGLANSLSDKFNRIESLAKKIATGYAFKKMADAMIKPAVKAYANYEQLVGGVETLFKEANVFVQQALRQIFDRFGEKFIQSLPAVIFAYHEFSHLRQSFQKLISKLIIHYFRRFFKSSFFRFIIRITSHYLIKIKRNQ